MNDYDPYALPDFETEFTPEDDFRRFEDALNAPEASPVIAMNDWRPIHQRVRRPGTSANSTSNRRKKPKRSKDETREGFVYTLLKWPFLVTVMGWLSVLSIGYILTRLYIFLYEHFFTWTGKRERLRRKLRSTKTYAEWKKAAEELDAYLGMEKWKGEDEYAYYDYVTVNKVTEQLKVLRGHVEGGEETTGTSTIEELSDMVKACVKNNFVGVENPRLYSETYSGTKNLVQEFIDEIHASLKLLLESDRISAESKGQLFKHLDTNFGRTALSLSGGATFSYYHFGVVKALLDNNVLPEIITGTSGGALVAALVATRTDSELKELLVPALAEKIKACHDRFPTWIRRWWRTGARFDSIDWARQCSWFCRGSTTFREAYERTGRILNVSCVPSDPHSPTILANYLTSPDCVIWSAVIASAAVPGILNPVVLMMKKPDGTLGPYSFGHKWKDGSLRTDIPLKALSLHFNANFSIVSQVNPHINLFFFSSRGTVGRPVTHRKGRGWRGGFLGSAAEQYIKLDLNKWLKVLRHLELLPRPLGQDWSEIWLQRFSGTVTIWPRSVPSDFYNILSDPSMQRLARMLHAGQQSAFPKVKFITNRMKIETLIREGLDRYSSSSASAAAQRRTLQAESEYMSTMNEVVPDTENKNDDAPTISTPRQFQTQRPQFRKRRSSVFEEIRRQSAVFFDDTDNGDGDGYYDTTASEEDGSVIAGEADGTRVG